MEKLRYKFRINASKEKVWHTMLDSETYREWTKAFSPNSRYIGEWKEGAPIRFVDPDLWGTKALLEEVKPYDRINRDRLEAYPPDTLFVVYCAGPHCNATEKAAIRLARLGRPVKKMIGGVTGWLDEGFDLVKK